MISVEEAHLLLAQSIANMTFEETRHLTQADNYILAQNILSPSDTPQFDQSNMDGYAILYEAEKQDYCLVDIVQSAGKATNYALNKGEAMRIFTGAPLPSNADTVVMQEHCEVKNGQLYIQKMPSEKGTNVRSKASQNQKGDILLTAGTRLNPAAIGYLAMHGISQIVVRKKPVIGLIITGDELISPEQNIANGQVYEANSYTLRALWARKGITVLPTIFVGDSVAAIEEGLQKAAKEANIIVVSGGASVGDFDFSAAAIQNIGGVQVFHRIKQKPGKPLFLAKDAKANKLYFALPGNPSSALVCAYEYINKATDEIQNINNAHQKISFALAHDYKKAAGLTHFVRGVVDFETKTVRILANQDSFRLDIFAQANALVTLAEEKTDFEAGESLPVLLLNLV